MTSALVTDHLGGGGDVLPVQFGAFLDVVDAFDASAFGIGRPEALAMGKTCMMRDRSCPLV